MKPHPTKFETLLSWLSFPVYAVQGLYVRGKAKRVAPPPQKPIIELKGKGEPIHILFIGDSTAAGVGVDEFDECVSGRIPALLSEKTGRPIYHRTAGNNSATSGQLRDFVVPNLEPIEYDYIAVSVGVNDSKNFHTTQRFRKEFGGLLYALHARFPDSVIMWQNLIDMEGIPLLPFPLNKILGIRSRLLRREGRELCFERSALAPDTNWKAVPENFAHDGFHASSTGYRIWAEEVVEIIADLENE